LLLRAALAAGFAAAIRCSAADSSGAAALLDEDRNAIKNTKRLV
jgi:hypothetical protein